jgi:hypothetical protein
MVTTWVAWAKSHVTALGVPGPHLSKDSVTPFAARRSGTRLVVKEENDAPKLGVNLNDVRTAVLQARAAPRSETSLPTNFQHRAAATAPMPAPIP